MSRRTTLAHRVKSDNKRKCLKVGAQTAVACRKIDDVKGEMLELTTIVT